MPTYFVACLMEGFLDAPADAREWRARPLTVENPLLPTVVASWARSLGGSMESWDPETGPGTLDLVSIEARVDGSTPDEAIDLAERKLRPVILAIAYRQLRPGRVFAWLAASEGGGVTDMRHRYIEPPRVYHDLAPSGWTPAQDIADLARAIRESPTAELYTALLADALTSESPEAMIVNLWSLLEALCRPHWHKDDDKRKAELRMVQRGLESVGIDETKSLSRAYHLRNVFLHQGGRGGTDDTATVRSALVRIVFEALARSRFAPLDPDVRRQVRAGAPRAVRRIRAASEHG